MAANTKETPPYVHDLERLAVLAGVELDEASAENLRIITGFNIAGRYGDIKFNLYQMATKKYTEKYLQITKQLFSWLKKQQSTRK